MFVCESYSNSYVFRDVSGTKLEMSSWINQTLTMLNMLKSLDITLNYQLVSSISIYIRAILPKRQCFFNKK